MPLSRILEVTILNYVTPQMYTTGTGIRKDGIRGVLIFFENGYSYQLHKESVHAFNLDPSDEDVKRLTLQLYNRITFQ
jgi:hypothetical protein